MTPKMICSHCMKVFLDAFEQRCVACGDECYDFTNNDEFLTREARRVVEMRRDAGLDGLVGGLACLVINTEPDQQGDAVNELLRRTGHDIRYGFEDDLGATHVLSLPGSADLLVQARRGETPFESVADCPKAFRLPRTRLETLVFESPDLPRYFEIQKSRGVHFLTDEIVEADDYLFIQTIPSTLTGLSTGVLQWKGAGRSYVTRGANALPDAFEKPALPHLKNIFELDHCATRVEARDRDPAIIEFMNLTCYDFAFSIYVQSFNSITNVARLSGADYAMVFTSGIKPFESDETSGPTEKFVHNYGRRVHHMAFRVEEIVETFNALKADGMEFLLELVGSPEEGLSQTFSEPSRHTLLVNEYIQRYGGFDGFFTQHNVTELTAATDKQ